MCSALFVVTLWSLFAAGGVRREGLWERCNGCTFVVPLLLYEEPLMCVCVCVCVCVCTCALIRHCSVGDTCVTVSYVTVNLHYAVLGALAAFQLLCWSNQFAVNFQS